MNVIKTEKLRLLQDCHNMSMFARSLVYIDISLDLFILEEKGTLQ
jgi:hypothetical protein